MKQYIKALIIDDEPGNIVTLSELLRSYCPGVQIAGTAPDIIKGYELIKAENPDVIFLDIEMPYGNAFELLDKLLPVKFEVIFITAFNDYAIKAFKYAALDYILKPVNINELKEAVQKLSKRIEEKNINTRISFMLTNMRTGNESAQKIGLPSSDGLYFEEVNRIMHLEAAGSYTHIYILNKRRETVSKHLKEFEDILPGSIFCRVHHSHIININYIKKYYKGRGGSVLMEDGSNIEISARKKDDFLKRFMH
ncbi:MAG TPA: LytTR family DNA-binding domain-containing protein [Ferruginibacter sp.]|nr:LytTR family DNA-binding domain-containing protein [Ferruginibacter sp.]